VPYNGSGAVPPWLGHAGGRPRICLTWGLSVSRVVQRLGPPALEPFRLAIDALSSLDVEVVVTTTPDQLETLGELPGTVRAVASVPLQLVLPSCALIVHQAGDGTALTAATAGIPQLAIAGSPEADMCGGRLAAAGAGICLKDPELREDPAAPAVIGDALAALLADPGYAAGAARLRAEIEHQPPPAELVKPLVTLVSGGG
jgi:glycosyltransferase